jgi:hypothetical protein
MFNAQSSPSGFASLAPIFPRSSPALESAADRGVEKSKVPQIKQIMIKALRRDRRVPLEVIVFIIFMSRPLLFLSASRLTASDSIDFHAPFKEWEAIDYKKNSLLEPVNKVQVKGMDEVGVVIAFQITL